MRHIAYTRRMPKANPADKQQQQQNTHRQTDRQRDSQKMCVCVSTSTHMSICWQHNAAELSPSLGLCKSGSIFRTHILVNKFQCLQKKKQNKGEKRGGRLLKEEVNDRRDRIVVACALLTKRIVVAATINGRKFALSVKNL